MKYIKHEEKAYNIHFIKTNKFKKIVVRINFKSDITKEGIAYKNMLSLILSESNQNYKTKRLLDIECENLYNISVGAGTTMIGNQQVLRFNTRFLNEKHTEPGMNEKSFQFFLNFIFNPNIENNQFDEQAFKNAKNILMQDIESFSDNPSRFSYSRLLETMCPDSVLSYRNVGYKEDLDKINRENLYEYYKEILKTNHIDIFIIGDIDEEQMIKIIKDNFKINTLKKPAASPIIKHTNYKARPSIVKEQKNLNQSFLIMGAKLKDITVIERLYTLPLYNSILGGGPDSKLFKEVREKNSLCYSVSSSSSGVSNLEYISAGIDSKNFDKAVKIIKKEMKQITLNKFSDEDLEQARTSYIAALKEIEDVQNGLINIYEAHEYLNYDLLDERLKQAELITKEDIVNVSKKIKLDTIFFLEGGKLDEEKN